MSLDTGPLQEEKADWLAPSYDAFLQFMALVCLVMGLVYWTQLIGISGNGSMRFDLLETNPRIAYTILAITLPFAGLGLWFRSSWGVVVWLGCALLQVIMYSVWGEEFGTNTLLIIYIALCMLALFVLNIWFFIRWRANRLTGY